MTEIFPSRGRYNSKTILRVFDMRSCNISILGIQLLAALAIGIAVSQPVLAQQTGPVQSGPAPAIVFTPGTGNGQALPSPPPRPVRPLLACSAFAEAASAILKRYEAPVLRLSVAQVGLPLPAPPPAPQHLLDLTLLKSALDSYALHNCRYGNLSGPAQFVIVDFAKPSSEPRLFRIDLKTGDGIDKAILVAHGAGSDPDDDGIAQSFGNGQDSLMSSLGAARGAEIYTGINGRSLRLDGLDPTNSAMRSRDIVAHSYQPEARRYFNASLRSMRSGRPGRSEGCFVVEPFIRDWLFDQLADGGFLYAGLGGSRAVVTPKPDAVQVTFVKGTGG
jgi:L,D-transpeptidase catalytic domain